MPKTKDTSYSLKERAVGLIATNAAMVAAEEGTYGVSTVIDSKFKPKPISKRRRDVLGKKMLGKKFYKRHVRNIDDHSGAAVGPDRPRKGKFRIYNVYNVKGQGEASAAHEFGHIKNYRALGRAGTSVANLRHYGPVVGAGAGVLSAAAFDPESKKAKAAPLAVAAAWTPLLVDEAAATYQATKQIGFKALKSLAPSFGTYLAPAAASVVAVEAVRRLRVHFKKKQHKGKYFKK